MARNAVGKVLERVANLSGFAFSLWLIYYGIITWSLWVVVGLFVAAAGAFNLGLFDLLGDYLDTRKASTSAPIKSETDNST